MIITAGRAGGRRVIFCGVKAWITIRAPAGARISQHYVGFLENRCRYRVNGERNLRVCTQLVTGVYRSYNNTRGNVGIDTIKVRATYQ